MTNVSLPRDIRPAARDPRQTVRMIQWTLPLLLFGIVVGYEFVEHILENEDSWVDPHFISEILFFGVLGPAAVILVFVYIRRLLGEQIAARNALEGLNWELEERVAERTANLAARNEELARANARLQELDQLKSDFISLVSHELRAPLTTLNGGLEVALQEAERLPPTARRTLEIMSAESARLTQFVQTILDLSRLEAGKLVFTPGPVAPRPLLQRASEVALAGTSREVRWDLQPRDLPPLYADETYLEEVLRALIRNANKYSPPGTPIHLGASVNDSEVLLRVTDHGPGILPAEQSRIFERFYRARSGLPTEVEAAKPGWGLGLYFARVLTEAQGGRLRVRSPAWPDSGAPGAEFTLALPVATGDPDETADA